MVHLTRRNALAGVGLVLLAGCGGGDTAAPPPTSSGPSPAPSPTPTPTPPPPPPVGSFGTLGVTTSQTFATLGYSQRGRGSGWDFVAEAGSLTAQPGHSMRYDLPGRLLLTVPTLGEGEIVPRNNEGSFINGERASATFNALGGIVYMSRPFVADRPQQYVMNAYFISAPEATNAQTNLMLAFAYGIATPPGALPASGGRDYATTYSDKGVTFRADYAAKVISGTIPFYTNGATLTSLLKDVTISADGTSFGGRVLPPDGSPEGTIQGLFMGPTGEEFVALIVLTKDGLSIFSGTRMT